MTLLQNPILRGFNPDPSIIRVGEDYYIATSTFEWFPGVQIHHSRDLVNWKLIARPLRRRSQLDMRGVPDSCGVWAPCLSYHEGLYYLVYSNVKSFDGVWKDTPNYLVTSEDIKGSWSDPIFLSSSGFDGSLFHDEDGRKWYTSMITDHRRGKFFGGIFLQEYDPESRKLTGTAYNIWNGTALGKTEGPHLYKRNGYYYLLTAEGGTEYGHAVSLARSKSITGPYEVHPQNPIITTRDNPKHVLQKCGHGDLVESPQGDWFAVFLVGRPLTQHGRCTLGRETAIEQVEWREDNWLYLKANEPRSAFELNVEGVQQLDNSERDDFDHSRISQQFQSLRVPMQDSWINLTARPGYLRLSGRESLSSFQNQSLIARRVQHKHVEASTCVDFQPTSFQQMAGLVCYYNTSHWYYLHVMGHDNGKDRYLQLISCDHFDMVDVLDAPVPVPEQSSVWLKAIFNRDRIQFFFAFEELNWVLAGSPLDGSILSDDYVREGSDRYRPAFTGAFVGINCIDLTGRRLHADFDWFDYKEIHE